MDNPPVAPLSLISPNPVPVLAADAPAPQSTPLAQTPFQALTGRVIALPETRELAAQTRMLEQLGASVLSCPMVGISDSPDQTSINKWLENLLVGRFDDVVFFTGEGVTRLIAAARRAGWNDGVVSALRRTRIIIRGPKPARALMTVNLRPQISAPQPTTDGLIEALRPLDLRKRTIGVQLYGQVPNDKFMSFLRQAGADPRPVAPYIYAPASDDQKVLDLIARLHAGQVDAVAFTNRSQIERLFEVAAKYDRQTQLKDGLQRTLVASIGPVVRAELETRHVSVHAPPLKNFFMKPLIQQIAEILNQRDVIKTANFKAS